MTSLREKMFEEVWNSLPSDKRPDKNTAIAFWDAAWRASREAQEAYDNKVWKGEHEN